MTATDDRAAVQTLGDCLERHLRRMVEFQRAAQGGVARRPYWGLEDFVLTHGRRWPAPPRPALVRGRVRECFKNAADRVIRTGLGDGTLTYVEGFAARAAVPLPVLHAWVADRAGRALELTWRLEPGEDTAYFGVPFRPAYLSKALLRSRRYGVLDRWETGWPLLAGTDAAADAVLPWPPRS